MHLDFKKGHTRSMEDKKFYWIKLKLDFFSLPTIDYLLSQDNGAEYVVLYEMLCLMSANDKGTLASNMNEILIPYDIEKIKRDTKYFSTDTIVVAVELFKKLGLIYQSQESGIIQISNFDNLIGQETKFAKDKREYRAKLKAKQITINSEIDPFSKKEKEEQNKALEKWTKDLEETKKIAQTKWVEPNKREK